MKTHYKTPQKIPDLHEAQLPKLLHANEILHKKDQRLREFNGLMQVKRNRQALEISRKPLFFFIGLSLSLLMIIVAFNWKTYDNVGLVDLGNVEGNFDEVIDIPISNQPPPPPPKKNLEVFELKEVEDEVLIEDMEIDLDMEMTENLTVEDVVYEDLIMDVEEEEVEEIFQVVETWPEPEGGMASFYQYVAENMNYPDAARRLNISGIVFIQFVVEKDGSITDVKVVKGIGAGCDEEAARVVSEAPDWNPGKQRGMAVRVYRTVPIRFILRER